MSKTPRVDAYMAANYSDAVFGHHLADFARQLEAENAEMAELLKRIVHGGRASILILEEARALLAKVNA